MGNCFIRKAAKDDVLNKPTLNSTLNSSVYFYESRSRILRLEEIKKNDEYYEVLAPFISDREFTLNAFRLPYNL